MKTPLSRIAVLALISLTLSGCAGTLTTRSAIDRDTHVFGGYPYQAVASDIYDIGGSIYHLAPLSTAIFAGALSLPLDCCIDTVALPADLILWARGHEKNRRLGSSQGLFGPAMHAESFCWDKNCPYCKLFPDLEPRKNRNDNPWGPAEGTR